MKEFARARFNRGLEVVRDRVDASTAIAEGVFSSYLLDCTNYEIDQTEGYRQIYDSGYYDGQWDFNTLGLYFFEGSFDTDPGVGFSELGGYSSDWAGGFFNGRYFYLGPNQLTPTTGSREWHMMLDPEGNFTGGSAGGSFSFFDANVVGDSTTEALSPVTQLTEISREGLVEVGSREEIVRGADIPPSVVNHGWYTIARHLNRYYSSGFKAPTELPSCLSSRTGAIDYPLVTGLFYFEDALYAVDASGSTTSEGQSLYKTTPAGWVEQDMGQEMAFNEGVFPIRFEDYIAWESSSRASYILGGTSSSTELDYFPGQVAYHIDGSNTEYWATVVHAHVGDGEFATGRYTDCEVATTVNIDTLDTTEYDNGGTIDGYTLATNDRVLVKDQDNAEENGIYVVQAAGALVRATDLDFEVELVTGHVTAVTGGDENGGKVFRVLNVDDLSVGVTGQLWTETTLAEGALTLYDVAQRTSGGTVSTTGITFPLSATWTEGNAINFSGGDNEPALGDRITDGTASATVLKVIVDQGDWSTNDASGTIVTGGMTGGTEMASGASITNTTQAGEAVGTTISIVRDSDRDDLFDNTTVNVAVTLPSWDEHVASGGLYQSLVHNFFATDDNDQPQTTPSRRIFVVNGAGNALAWDGAQLVRIRTNSTDDRPRHVSVHSDRLFLGFGDGSTALSVSGEPLNFSGVDGALALGFSNPITGLVSINGDTTVVFTDRTVEMLQGTNDATLIRRTISENSGAVEYTASNIGDVIYTDRHGVNLISATEAYGDFNKRPLSEDIRPLIETALRSSSGDNGFGAATGFATPAIKFAVAARNRSQYRLFLENGLVLTCTLRDDGGIAWSKQDLSIKNLDWDEEPILHCYAAGIDSQGEDALFHFVNSERPPGSTEESRAESIFGPRRLDWIPGLHTRRASALVGPIFFSGGTSAHVMDTVCLHGEFTGQNNFSVSAPFVNYDDKNLLSGSAAADIKIGEDDSLYRLGDNFFFQSVTLAARGHGIGLKIDPAAQNILNSDASVAGFPSDGPVSSPPHRLLGAIMEISPRRRNLS